MKKIALFLSLISAGFSWSQTSGNEMFDESYVHEIRITFEQEDYWDSLEYYYAQYLEFGADKQYMLASIEIDGEVVDSVGVRQKGFFSNWGSDGLKEPLKVDFNEFVPGKRYDGLKKINLQNGFGDPTMMRDALAYHFMRDAGIAAPRSSYAKVYLNDTYWGLYIVVEQVDNKFLKNWFENNNGNLYKCINNTNLDWQGTLKSAYEDEFELKTNEEADEWESFIDMVDKINDEDEFEDSIGTKLQMDTYTSVLAADVLMLNWDSYYEHGRNFYVFYDSTAGLFQWIPWDYNLAFSDSETDILIEYEAGDPFTEPKPLVENVMDSDFYRSMYFNHLCIMIEHHFTLANLEGYIDDTRALITEALDEDPNKYYTMGQFNTSITTDITVVDDWGMPITTPGLKSFISDRETTVAAQLAAHGHSCTALSVDEEERSVPNLIYPNPSQTGIFTIQFNEEVTDLVVYSIYGELILTQNVAGNQIYELDLSDYASGMYVVEFQGESRSVLRVVKQ